MLTLLTLALWMAGLGAMLAGHLVIGACIAAVTAITAPRALARRDDMETAFGCMLLFVLGVGLLRAIKALGAVLL